MCYQDGNLSTASVVTDTLTRKRCVLKTAAGACASHELAALVALSRAQSKYCVQLLNVCVNSDATATMVLQELEPFRYFRNSEAEVKQLAYDGLMVHTLLRED